MGSSPVTTDRASKEQNVIQFSIINTIYYMNICTLY